EPKFSSTKQRKTPLKNMNILKNLQANNSCRYTEKPFPENPERAFLCVFQSRKISLRDKLYLD
ncbi:MAG: hypothetical protein IJM98_06395, partial [Oscillospiraceae bacterium]|nr:hypothetical protein [Oscillospiraceae bacterium]MBQ6700277.1 hypothetical protein [Oscillospiraceae bacterium]